LDVITAHLEEYGTYEIILPYEAIKRMREVLAFNKPKETEISK